MKYLTTGEEPEDKIEARRLRVKAARFTITSTDYGFHDGVSTTIL